ncbi:mitochondrial carrier domain-containing protein [Chytriomyces cf. hyalinus JEL632]|nr:mitochondrial carrier domain-containing protein [Chytriomyces cf. hyalinus JEL632]
MASDNVVHALAGAGGGMVSMALTYPLVTVSTRAQINKAPAPQSPSKATSADAAASTVKAPVSAFKAQKDAFLKIIREEGVAGLYSGVESAMFGIAVTQGVYYYWYETVKAAFEAAQEAERSISTFESMAAGAVAGAATSLITNPIWVVNVRATVKKSSLDDGAKPTKPLTTMQIVSKIYNEEGITGFWKGIIPALILVINPIIQYTVFEKLKDLLQQRRTAKGGGALTGFDFFLLGAVSKLAATSITYPYIVVKSRMQLKQSDNDKERYNNVVDGIRKIVKAEGVAGLYKGIEAKLVQSVLASAFTFAFKEELYNSACWLLVLLKLREAKKL